MATSKTAYSQVDLQDAARESSDVYLSALNSAIFIWHLYGSIIGVVPTSQSMRHTHICWPFWIPICLTEDFWCTADSLLVYVYLCVCVHLLPYNCCVCAPMVTVHLNWLWIVTLCLWMSEWKQQMQSGTLRTSCLPRLLSFLVLCLRTRPYKALHMLQSRNSTLDK